MTLAYLANESHYAEHLLPVWRRTGGVFLSPPPLAEQLGVTELQRGHDQIGDVCIVASEHDRQRAGRADVIRMSHGAGMSYGTTWAAYPGGGPQHRVVAFLCANEYGRSRWASSFPEIGAEIVGTPKLDNAHNAPPKPLGDPPVVAISFAWGATAAPETTSALPHFEPGLQSLAGRRDIHLIGHGHPRARRILEPLYRRLGIPAVWDFEQVLTLADVYVCDTSSTIYEFCSLNRPVVLMDAPWYRRDVEHGLRFWTHSGVGPHACEPEDLSGAIIEAITLQGLYRPARLAATEACYPYRGHAAERAAAMLAAVTAGLG